ncbi:hypothetical protein BD560DRAFT_405474 [Blakeslea trispora]|nr:hypothetical protein BD560DRAFT_405474 [Blakeslea trispora]
MLLKLFFCSVLPSNVVLSIQTLVFKSLFDPCCKDALPKAVSKLKITVYSSTNASEGTQSLFINNQAFCPTTIRLRHQFCHSN